jgi:hypothetical protein
VNLIWLPIFSLLGLFLYASTLHPTMSNSPLVGYDEDVIASDPKTSVALVHLPIIFVFTTMVVYSHDYGRMGCALLASVGLGLDLAYVLRIQRGLLSTSSRVGGGNVDGGDVDVEINPSDVVFDNAIDAIGGASSNMYCGATAVNDNDGGGGGGEDYDVVVAAANSGEDTEKRSTVLLEYAALRLPFALYGGYALSLISMHLCAFLINIDMPTWVYLLVANVCIVGMCAAGLVLLWRGRFYGAGMSLIWYLVSTQ